MARHAWKSRYGIGSPYECMKCGVTTWGPTTDSAVVAGSCRVADTLPRTTHQFNYTQESNYKERECQVCGLTIMPDYPIPVCPHKITNKDGWPVFFKADAELLRTCPGFKLTPQQVYGNPRNDIAKLDDLMKAREREGPSPPRKFGIYRDPKPKPQEPEPANPRFAMLDFGDDKEDK